MARWLSFWMYPAGAALLIGLAASRPGSMPPVWEAAGLVGAGLLAWTLIEYLFHRYIFHGAHEGGWLERFAGRHHTAHHADAENVDYIFVRPLVSLIPSTLLFGGLYLALGLAGAALVLTGIWTGFLAYEAVHYRVHRAPRGRLLRNHARRHFHHHFRNERVAFGVTTGLWDRILGTRFRS